jgi:hypothetical protein
LASKWKKKSTLLGLSNGARMLMLLLPDSDPAKAWQMADAAGKEDLFQLAADIFLYAVDKNNLSKKGETYIVEADPNVRATMTVDIARLKYEGNWDPEPGGWKRLNAMMHNEDHIDLNITALDLATPAALTGKKIAHLTGTGPCKLSAAEVEGIKQFIKEGGTLVIDAAGGNRQFAQSMEGQFKAIFGDDAGQLNQALPPDHILYTTGGALQGITYRAFARATLGSVKGPRLRGPGGPRSAGAARSSRRREGEAAAVPGGHDSPSSPASDAAGVSPAARNSASCTIFLPRSSLAVLFVNAGIRIIRRSANRGTQSSTSSSGESSRCADRRTCS